MSILVAEHIQHSWGDRLVLSEANLRVDERDRVALVGANGSGKSTLLQILAGSVEPDSGVRHLSGSIALLAQRPDLPGRTVADAAAAAVSWHADLLTSYEKALEDGDEHLAAQLQDQLDQRGWSVEHQVAGVLDRVGAPPMEAEIAKLSGGERRRVALATTLLRQPDLLLLDEPTNHLDADAVEWLQAYLIGYRGAVVLVTHDRYLLEAVADRIVEVDRGETVAYDGSYGDYLVARAERRARLKTQRGRLLRLVAQEAAWAARSPSARTTKQKARLQRLDSLRESVPQLSERTYQFSFASGIHKGSTLIQGRGIRKGYGDRVLIDGLDFEIRPGERLGVLGPNGAGKSTLVRLVTEQETPDSGAIERYARATIGLLDQARSGLKEDDTVLDAAADGRREVMLGKKEVSVQGFLGYFAFDREMYDQKVASLSGGERARLLLARLMLQGHPILLLDEPTNDLDLLTLRVLEQALLDFDGAALIVTHDRAFLDRVCTGVLAFEGNGQVTRYASRQQAIAARKPVVAEKKAKKPRVKKPKPVNTAKLEAKIEKLEAEHAEIEAVLAEPETYTERKDEVPGLVAKLEALEAEIEAAYEAWG